MQARHIAFALLFAGCAWGTSAGIGSAGQQGPSRQIDPSDRQMRFREMDVDGDGVITRSEWRGNTQSFREHDRNRDGVLSGDEIWVVQQRRGPFATLDRNANGVITRSEWTGLPDEFRALDTDGDGVLTQSEYRQGRQVIESPAYRAGRERGLTDGRQAGRDDRTINGGKWDLEGQRELETADAGYTSGVGTLSDYQAGYRSGFRTGYREGFGPR